MLAKITLYDGTVYRIADRTQDTSDGLYLGKIKDELSLASQMSESGNTPVSINMTILNDDNFIASNKDLWAAEVLITSDTNMSWKGKIDFFNFDADGNVYITATEKTAPELELQIPDEVRQVYTVDEDFHQSSVTMTIPLVVGGTSSNPITLSTILIDKINGIYLVCVGEIRSIVKVYNGAEELPQTAYTAYTGTSDQEENAGFAYVQIAEDYRLNSDGSYAEINVDVVGLKLGSHTEAECRNGARFLYYFLTTAATGVNGWGCGIDSSMIDTDSFNSAITLCDQLGYKLDGIMWMRQSAQSWIDQICQAIHGTYSINADGKRRLFIDYAGNASKKTFTASNMRVDRRGKNSYTSVVCNKGVFSYDYNPITGLFMQTAQYENADSIAQIGEQRFTGESYLIKDSATALAVLEYTCKRSQSAAEAIEFSTDDIETVLKAGDIITINRPDLSINNSNYQIENISVTDFQAQITAVKFDTSVFSVTGTASTVNWGNERDITPALTPAQATNLLLSTGFDINPDGTGIPYISGTFTVPDGGWFAAAVQYGIGTNPSNWTEMALITEGRFKLSPVNVDTVYSIRVRMITATGHSSFITGVITATGDTIPPSKPTISAKATDRTVTIQCGLDTPPADMGGFQIYRKKSTDSESAYTYIGSIAANSGYAAFSDYVDEYVTYNYKAKSYDRSGNLSTNFSSVASVTVTGIQANDVAATALAMPTGSILRLSAKNCTTASIAENNGVKDCSGRGNHGRAYNGVQVVQDDVMGDCFSFGTSNNIRIECPAVNIGSTDSFTIMLRYKRTGALPSPANQLLFSAADSNNVAKFSIYCATRTSVDTITATLYTNSADALVFDISSIGKHTADWHFYTLSYDYNAEKLKLYLDGELVFTQDFAHQDNFEVSKFLIGFVSSNVYHPVGLMCDIRAFGRCLSATEIKSAYMNLDEAVFAQLTTDMFGANIIHANYILNDGDFQTLAVNAVNANINNLNVAGNATFTGLSNKVTAKYGTCSTGASTAAKVVTLSNFVLFTGAQISVKFSETNSKANPTLNVEGTGAKTIRAKGANLTASSLYNWVAGDVVDFVYDGTYWVISDISAKDYSNTELAKKMSIASYCSANDTTKIDGANIYAGSVTATQMAANSITTEKLAVTAISRPIGCKWELSLKGVPSKTFAQDDILPDGTGFSTQILVKGTTVQVVTDTTYNQVLKFGTSGYLRVDGSWFNAQMTFDCIYGASAPTDENKAIVDGRNSSFYGFGVYHVVNTGKIQVVGNSATVVESPAAFPSGYHRLTVIWNNSATYKTKIYLDGVLWIQSTTQTASNASGTMLSYCLLGSNSARSGNINSSGWIKSAAFWKRALSDSEVKTLFMMGIDNESGQITADRIATDAIRSRNFTDTNADILAGKAFSSAGTFLNLSGGTLTAPKFRYGSDGSCAMGAFTVQSDGSFKSSFGSNGYVTLEARHGLTIYDPDYYATGQFRPDSTYWAYGPPGTGGNQQVYLYVYNDGSTYNKAILKINPASTDKYGLYVAGKARINATDYTSDESTKKDFQDVSTLDKLKALRVCAWRFDEEKLVEKENDWIDAENIKIEAENKTIDAENAEIEKENELRKSRKDGGEDVELIPLKEHKKLREHRIADKNANHPLNIGCMAGEFNKAFGTNNGSEEALSITDTIGVCMRAIQELAAEVDDLKAKLKIQQDEKSEIIEHFDDLVKEPTDEDELVEPSFDELLKTDENQQEEQK